MSLTFQTGPTQNIRVLRVQPPRQVLQPLENIKVEVTFESSPEVPDGGEGTLAFSAITDFNMRTTRNTMVYFTKQVRVIDRDVHANAMLMPIRLQSSYDNWDPRVTYNYIGDCKGHDRPDTCDGGEWKFEATFQDETSGLKKVLSEPYGLIFKTRFVAGTKAPVSVYYTASCCKPKIDIWAEDSHGNYVRRSLDAYNRE